MQKTMFSHWFLIGFQWDVKKDYFLNLSTFHSSALSDCGENISNLRKNTFAKYFCGILFWESFCAGNIFCETVSNFLTLLTTICHTLFTFCPTALYASGKMPSADRLVLKRYSKRHPLDSHPWKITPPNKGGGICTIWISKGAMLFNLQ